MLLFDTESDGLLSSASRIWCISCKNLRTGRKASFDVERNNIKDFNSFLDEEEVIVGHNIIAFDIPLLRKFGFESITSKRPLDTLVLSRLLDPKREGGHSLEAWGNRLGFHKQEHEDWTQFSPEMMSRCDTDVHLNELLLNHLRKEARGYSPESIRTEMRIQQILEERKATGFYYDVEFADRIREECKLKADELEQEILSEFPPKKRVIKSFFPRKTSKGSIHSQDLKTLENNLHDLNEDGSYTVFKLEPFMLSSPKQIVERMNEAGWKPTDFTKTGNPKVSEENFETLPEDAPASAHKLSNWMMLNNRVSTLDSWRSSYNPETHAIHGEILGVGTWTHRMIHRDPNTGNICSHDKPYGKELRSLWSTPEGRVLVGADASGIQLRILAHYMRDQSYVDQILGGDIHTYNQQAAGLDTRSQAKTFIYAWILGAGDEKIGSIVGGTAKDGKKIKKRFLDSLPSLKRVKDQSELDAERGFIVGLDGRKCKVESAHKTMAAYLQNGEAVVMKLATLIWYDKFKELGIDFNLCTMVHDEWQVSTVPDQAETVGKLMVDAIREAGERLQVFCPLTGDYRIGRNWYDTH